MNLTFQYLLRLRDELAGIDYDKCNLIYLEPLRIEVDRRISEIIEKGKA